MNGSISANSFGIVDTPGEFAPLREQFVIIVDPLKLFALHPNRQPPGAL
jgi:hypothetical protein